MRLLMVFPCLVALLVAQPSLSTRVEQGLRGPVAMVGEPPIRYAIAERMAALKVPGVSIAVVDAGKIAWARGYGQTGDGRAVTEETMFQAASLSKPLSAMVALRLVELGTLALDEDVNVKLKSWKVPASAAAQGEVVTLRRLLSHTAGLTVSGFPGYAVGKPLPTLVQLLDGSPPANTAAIRVDIKPGTASRYSGGGYEVMQLLVEDVTGKPFARVAQELVLGPLGMTHSTFEQPLPAAALARSAAGHDDAGARIPGLRHTYPELTAAGLWTTPSDFAQVILEIHTPGRVLRPETVETMLTPIMNGYGLGFGVQSTDGHASFSHNGGNEGFRCTFRGYRDAPRGAVVMTNSNRGMQVALEVMRSISATYDWPDYRQREVTKVAVPAATLRTYEGRYRRDGNDAVVTLEADTLVVRLAGGARAVLWPTGANTFVDETGMLPDVTFSPNAAGEMQLAAGGMVATRVTGR